MKTQTKYTLIVLAMCVLMMGAGQGGDYCPLFPPPGLDSCGNMIGIASKGWVCANPNAPVNQNTTCSLPLGAENGGNAFPCLAMNECIGPAASFKVTVPAAVQSGLPFTFTVQALNNGGGTSTNYTGTVQFTAPGSQAGTFTLPANATLTNGKGTFTTTLNEGQVQNQFITVTDTADPTITGTSPLIRVQVTRLVVTAPATVASGIPFSFMVTALDVNNAVFPGYTGTLHFDGSVGAAVLPADSTLTNGTGAFSATLPEIGVPTQFIGATDTANPFIQGASSAIHVVAGSSDPATHFQVTAPTAVIAGIPFSFSVQALNDSAGPTSNYTGKVHFTNTGAAGSAVLPADTKLNNGAATFSATFNASLGQQSIVATDTVKPSITGQSALITTQVAGVPAFRSPSPRADEPHLLTAAADCPPIGFFQPTSLQTVDTDVNNQNLLASVLYRQPDGSFTAQGFSLPGIGSPEPQLLLSSVGTGLGDIPQAQRFFANCRGLAPWATAPHPTVLANMLGTMSLPFVVTNLGGAPYAEILPSPHLNSIRVSLDTQGTLGQSATVYPVGVSPTGVLVADFNGDGLRDVAILNRGASGSLGSVSILLGMGGGLLAQAKSFNVGNLPVAMTSFDFNKDGHADLAVVNQTDNTVTVLIANADGTMKPGVTLPLPGTAPIVNSIVSADFDGDTIPDILVYSSLGFSLLHGNGDGTFQVLPQKTGQSVDFGSQFLAAGDFNKDGKMDVASYNSDGTVTILLNAGDGSFPNAARFVAGSLGSAGVAAGGMFATDFNDDGNLDLVFGSGHPDAVFANPAFVTVLLGNGDGTLQAPPARRVGLNTTVLARADFNGDNRNDVVVAADTSSKTPGLWILLGAAGGGFQTPTALAVPSSGTLITWVATGDVNGDGRADIVAIDDKGTLFAFLGNGNGTFQTPSSVNVAPSGSFVVTGDLNGDGHADAVFADGTLNALTATATTTGVAIAGGTGFSSVGSVQTGPNTLQVALADVNGDHNLDLIAVNHGVGQTGLAGAQPSAGNVSVSFGNGDGTFQAPVSYPVGLNPTSIAVADVNGDGKPDLIVGSVTATSAVIGVLINAGNGAFGSPAFLPTYSWPANIVAADFDGDGNQDFAVVHTANDPPISIFRGHGDGTFDPETLLFAGSQPQAAVAADFTGDGKLDLAVSNFASLPGASGTVNLFANISGIQPSATHFVFAGPPSAVFGGTSGFVLSALDFENNVVTGYTGTVHFTSTDGAASLPANITFTAASQGVFAFTASLKSLGSQTITATDTVNPSITGTSGAVAVAASTGPAWTVGMTNIGSFSVGQPLAFFTITVANTQSLSPTTGTATVSVVFPVPVTLSGPNWNCGATSCTRSDTLAAGASYPAITATANLASFPLTVFTGTVFVSGGGLASASATDSATLVPALTDVPTADLSFLPFIDLLRQTGITSGCAPTGYCPDNTITQGEMAVFVVRSVMGGDNFTFTPNPYFTDVPVTHQFFKWIQKEQDLGIALTCGSQGLFCPSSAVTRAQMAVLIIRARYGLTNPPNLPASPLFTDVLVTDPSFPFIQKMSQVGITVGCGVNQYCPTTPVTRGQMAVFIMKGMFNLLLPGPPPTLSAAPSTIVTGQTATVTIQGLGTNFVSGTTQVSAGPGITVTNVNVINATTLTAQFAVAANATPGTRSILVITGSQEATLPNVFQVTGM